MIFLETGSTDPAYNLAFEEYVLTGMDAAEDYFLLWQNDNAVIVGRYQNTVAEVNLPFAEAHGTKIVRRMSGGGAVYHDLGNLNFSLITDAKRHEDFDFSFFVQPLVSVLERLGIHAEFNGRNDVTIDGKKFSGNSQYLKNGRLLHHGTIMLSSDLAFVQQVLTVSQAKLQSKGVKSVRSRVTAVNEHLTTPVTPAEFQTLLLEEMGHPLRSVLTDRERYAIHTLSAEKYRKWNWNFGRDPQCSIEKTARVKNVGTITAHMETDHGTLTDLHFSGDFFSYDDPDTLSKALIGASLEPSALRRTAEGLEISRYISGLTPEALTQLLLC